MSFRAYRVGVVLSAVALFSAPSGASAQEMVKGQGSGFRLFARVHQWAEVNRVSCGITSYGDLCNDPTSGLIGAAWPKNSPQGYIFNSGLQVAGVVEDGIAGFSWSGDTTGGFFYDPKGTTQHGQEVEPVWNYSIAEDRANWPAMARVGATDPIFAPALRGRASVSEGDLWSMAWEGDTALMAGRPHPLGIAIETRVLAWNYPFGNQDVLYFVHTLYNVTSACPADYVGVRPELRDRLISLGQRFQETNNARFGVTIPTCGYDITDLYVSSAHDHDVSSDAGNNYGSVNLPLAMGYSYQDNFRGPDFGYLLPSSLRAPPFMNGYGFVGSKFLGTPAGTPEEAIRLYTVHTSGGLFPTPANAAQLFRYLSGHITPALGDGLCNYGDPLVSRICFIKSDAHHDTRAFQSTGPANLPAGAALTVATVYVFASAVANPGCPAPNCASVVPGDPLRLIDPVALASGANLIDSMAGFRGYVDDNGDGVVQGSEFRTVRGSLIHKAQLAQEIFDRGFLIPAPPEAPSFFLVPGDDRVSILWRPSATEATGDPFFDLAGDPTAVAYDPNFRQFDVEGYRIYRGRTADPSQLTLLAQFDHFDRDTEGHDLTFRDYLGVVGGGGLCAPELGRNTTAEGCPVNYPDSVPAGTSYTVYEEYDLAGPFVQVRLGDRFLTSTGEAFVIAADTAVTGGGSGLPELWNNGAPFVWIDSSARNNLRYFYTVTAFDVNSIQSGPSSLESARVLKDVTPVAPASNYDNSGALDVGMFGRGVNMTAAIDVAPTIAPTTGVFSGPARPATGTSIGFVGQFVAQVVTQSGEMSVRLDSMAPGSAYDNAPSTFWYSVLSAAGTVPLTLSVPHDQFNVPNHASGAIDGGPISGERAARYGGSTDYHLTGFFDLTYPGNYYTGSFGRGCVNGAPGFRAAACDYNGARWFDDSTEVFAHPTQGNNNNFANELVTNRTTAGSLAGVANVYEARSYHTRPNTYRTVEGVLGTVATAADYRVWWGANGTVDSVVDITHNVRLPFAANFDRGYRWGFLTLGAQAVTGAGFTDQRGTVISVSDFGCVNPLRAFAQPRGHLSCTGGPTYLLENNLDSPGDFGPLAFGHTLATDRTITPTTNQGFGMYIAGHIFLFEMNSPTPTAPAAGSLWTLRSYVGSVNGGTGGPNRTGGSFGNYSFTPQPSPFTAVGATLSLRYTVTNALRPTTWSDLSQVHTIPDPYYRTNGYETDPDQKIVKFVNLPDRAIIRIYSLSGILVKVIEHNSSTFGGQAEWDVRNQGGRLVASGVYFYHLESPSGARRVGRMTVVTDGR